MPDRVSAKPILAALDLLGRRWSLRLIWELRRDPAGFDSLRIRTGASPSTLSRRLGELLEAGVVDRDSSRRYRLSASGQELGRMLFALNRWAEREREQVTEAATADG